MTRTTTSSTGNPDDETRLGSSAGSSPSAWLSSSGEIDHGRFPPGTLLGGRYRIVGRLGRGGMGEVFRADDLKLGQPVALKFLPTAVDRDPARLTQLHTEVRMARQVSHPNVCRVYDIDEIDGHTFLSMEYVDGEDLASLLRRIGRFPEDRGLEIARQICAGLAAAPERGVIHRDFKPANVMLAGGGRVRITDFGLAGASGEAIRAGTPAYMAPEQLAGSEVTARSDIYALGLVLYELFTGKRALEGSSLAELIRRRELGEIAPPSAIVRDLSPEIDRAVMRCLALDAGTRPASALTVAAALPGGDPLAAALAAGETPSPQMVAAAGEGIGLSRLAGISLLAFVFGGLLAVGAAADRILFANRVTFEKSADVLEDRARELLRRTGYIAPPVDTARGLFANAEYVSWLGRTDPSPTKWDALGSGQGPLLRFWFRTSPRPLIPVGRSWIPGLNDPPLALSGMATVVLDDRARLLEFVAVPPQLDASDDQGAKVDWEPFFEAAGLPMGEFAAVAPHWTPRVYADDRLAWEGPMPGRQDARLRVETASYRGTPVSFQIVWPWTRAVRMDPSLPSARARILSVAGTMFLIVLMIGAIALARHNMRSGRADRRGASRVAVVLIGIWTLSWAFGARHSLSVDTEFNLFFSFLSVALLNVGFTWLFYLGLEPFVRRYCPEILISWTRVLDGRFNDPRVGRDLLVGLAGAVLLSLVSFSESVAQIIVSAAPSTPWTRSVEYLLGARYTISGLLRIVPNALQIAMTATFAYVLLLALVGRRRWIAIGAMVALLVAVIVFESPGANLWQAIGFSLAMAAPLIFVFVRFGLVATATLLMANQALNLVPLTLDLGARHAPVSAMVILATLAVAAYAFQISRAGEGLLQRFRLAG